MDNCSWLYSELNLICRTRTRMVDNLRLLLVPHHNHSEEGEDPATELGM